MAVGEVGVGLEQGALGLGTSFAAPVSNLDMGIRDNVPTVLPKKTSSPLHPAGPSRSVVQGSRVGVVQTLSVENGGGEAELGGQGGGG